MLWLATCEITVKVLHIIKKCIITTLGGRRQEVGNGRHSKRSLEKDNFNGNKGSVGLGKGKQGDNRELQHCTTMSYNRFTSQT